MALTDLLNGAGRVVQAAALGLAVQGCGGAGGEKRLCSSYLKDCPNSLPSSYTENIKECDGHFTPEKVRVSESNDDNFMYCIMKTRYCLDLNNPDTTQGEMDPEILSCMESLG